MLSAGHSWRNRHGQCAGQHCQLFVQWPPASRVEQTGACDMQAVGQLAGALAGEYGYRPGFGKGEIPLLSFLARLINQLGAKSIKVSSCPLIISFA